MKKIVFIISLWLLQVFQVYACSTCGCSAGGSSIGILPQYNNHFVGIRLYQRSFTSYMTHSALKGVNYSKENYSTLELFARFYPSKRVQLFIVLPYNIFSQKEGNTTYQSNGMGDPTIIANYVIVNTAQHSTSPIKHSLLAGAGIKLPLGSYQKVHKGETDFNPNLQNGTGSADFIIDMIYTLRRKSIGFNTELNYKYNLSNNLHYHFGNRFTSTVSLFYWISKKKVSLLPQLGLQFEQAQSDSKMKAIITQSGGNALYALPGLDIYIARFGFGVKSLLPLYQNYANKQIISQPRWMANFLINF